MGCVVSKVIGTTVHFVEQSLTADILGKYIIIRSGKSEPVMMCYISGHDLDM
jgi:hypothetical protein